MNLLTAKIIAMAVMGFGVLICGLLPIKLRPLILKGEENSKRRRHRERFISGLLCFGAGVLLATVFTHMLPETRMEFEKARKLGLLGGGHHDDGGNKTDNVAVVNLPEGSNGRAVANIDHNHGSPGRSPDLQFNDQAVPPYKEIAFPANPNGHKHDEPRVSALRRDEFNNAQSNSINHDNKSLDPNHDHGHDHNHDHNHDHSHDHNHDRDHDQDRDHAEHVYPIAELVICLGFFFIYVVEEFVHKFFLGHKHSDDDEGEDGHHHHHSHVPSFGQNTGHKHDDNHEKSNGQPYSVHSNGDVLFNNNKDSAPRPDWGGHGMDNPVFSGDVETAENQRMRPILLTHGKVLPITSSPTSSPRINGSSGHSREASLQLNKSAIDNQNESEPKIDLVTNVRGLLIVVALGFHAVFEGMAVGLQEEVMDVWYLFFAISAHKYVVKFCIGLELLENNTPRLQMVLSIITLALMTPIGIAIGIIVTENSGFGGSEHILVIAVLQGLAGGTLLYITFFEIMDRERSKPGARVIKLFCFALGFAGMASMEAIGGHSH